MQLCCLYYSCFRSRIDSFSYSKNLDKESGLNNHIASVHGEKRHQGNEPFKCSITLAHKGKVQFKCIFCNYSAQKSSLNRHIASVHARERHLKSFTCNICDHKFSQKNSLDRHIASVHEGKKFKRKSCNKEFSQKMSLKKLVTSVHEEKAISCI